MDRNILTQYSELVKESEELKKKISDLKSEIKKIEKRIAEIEAGDHVKDKVRGGMGGIESFNIEGVPQKEYEKKKTLLYTKKLTLKQRMETLEKLQLKVERSKNDVETFISNVEDSRIRRILHWRYIENLSWNQVADRMGGGNSEDCAKKALQRFFKKNCPTCPAFL